MKYSSCVPCLKALAKNCQAAHTSSAAEVVLVITIAILVTLFSAQRYGTEIVGAAFAPILIVWFISIAGNL